MAHAPRAQADRIARLTDYALRIDETHGKRGMDLHDPERRRRSRRPDAALRVSRTPAFAPTVDTPQFRHLLLERVSGGDR